MRTIKFRAWDRKGLEFIEIDKLSWTDVPDWPIKVNNRGDHMNGKQYILMQFTGLKDKHGREIYEDDILSSLYDNSEHAIHEIGTVAFSEYWGAYVLESLNKTVLNLVSAEEPEGSISASCMEIIGNIHTHERPTLPEKSAKIKDTTAT